MIRILFVDHDYLYQIFKGVITVRIKNQGNKIDKNMYQAQNDSESRFSRHIHTTGNPRLIFNTTHRIVLLN